MLASFLLYLRPLARAIVGPTVGRSLHALFLTLVGQADAQLAQQLHADAAHKPFTVSILQGKFTYQAGKAVATPDEVYHVRYTVLSDQVMAALLYILQDKHLSQEPVLLENQLFLLAGVAVEPAGSGGWARISSYEALLSGAAADPRITLQFDSPTTFRQGDLNLLFPLPVSVFGSYLRRWQALAPVQLDAEGLLDFVATQVVAERYQLQTRVVSYGNHQFNGFVGECTYRVFGADARRLQVLNALADFALFAGTGQKTTQGMGQTRRVT